MTQAKCFNCGISLEGIGKSMEKLIEDELPLFCCVRCSEEFPTDEKEKKIRFERLKRGEFTI